MCGMIYVRKIYVQTVIYVQIEILLSYFWSLMKFAR